MPLQIICKATSRKTLTRELAPFKG